MAREHYDTLQQVFDDAYRGLAAQGFQLSASKNGGCAYDGGNGIRCAIGWTFTRLELKRFGAYEGFVGRLVDDELPAKYDADIAVGDLEDLQTAHDAGSTPDRMRASLLRFAEQRSLTIPTIA